ncbi:DNase I-like protein [Clavulina sp. PMI_390]|nr:DNase I-like protein [Clavulina sp. PMI_390]
MPPPPIHGHRSASITLPPNPTSALLPPPTRNVSNPKPFPTPRKTSGGNHSDDGGSSDSEKRLDEFPDSTHSSRRKPAVHPLFNIHVPAHVGVVAVAGNCVVVGHHSIKVYDLDAIDTPLHHSELKDLLTDIKIKEHQRVTAIAFRPAVSKEDEGRFVWCGMKDGHLFEYDAWSGGLVHLRQSAHAGTVTHIMRHGRNMVTVGDAGKAFLWSPPGEASELALSKLGAGANMRYMRIPERQGFVKIFGNQMWTANGPGNNNTGAPTTTRGPTIRVYDISPNTTGVTNSKTLITSDVVGQVTCGAMIPSRPEKIYLGHEGGVITLWNKEGQDGSTPAHVGTIKIGMSDVLSLEGVRSKLWAGSRVGTIAAYEVDTLPWTVTNLWKAHEDYPVLQIEADPYSIEKCARFTVFSIGRDERVRFWDGLLGVEHIENDLLKREEKFSTFRQLRVLIGSWNIDAAKPELLSSNGESVSFLAEFLRSIGCTADDAPDIIVFGFQEVIDLESRKLTAKNVILGASKRAGTISDRVSKHYRMWLDALTLAIRTVMPFEIPYSVIHHETLVGLFSCVFVKNSERSRIRDPSIAIVKRGLKGVYGNKGAIAARFTIDDSSICFINCHLAAGQNHVRERNTDVAAVLEEKAVFPTVEEPEIGYVGGGDGSMILDHELCFLNGDLNYRIDQRRDIVLSSIQAGDLEFLLQHDQLNKEMRLNPSFRLRAFTESPIRFIPTYKYDRRSNEFDSSEKNRIPAWCDRILYRCRDLDRVRPLHYQRYEANISDHRPISAGFEVRVKSVDNELREREKEKVEKMWRKEEVDLLREAHRFYIEQGKL